MNNKYVIDRFPIEKLKTPCAALFCGPPGQGKTFCMRDWIFHVRQKYYDGTVITGTTDPQNPWTNEFAKDHVKYEFNESDLDEIFKKQDYRKRVCLEKYGMKDYPPHLTVCDDLEYKKKNILNCETVRRIMMNRRWSKIGFFVAFQYIMEVVCSVRSLFDYCVFTQETSTSVRQKIYKQFGSTCQSFAEFDQIFKACTEKQKRVLVIDLQPSSYEIRDSLFYYEPRAHTFEFGSADFRKHKRDLQNGVVQEYAPKQSNVTLVRR